MTASPPTLFVCTHRRLGAGSCGGSGGEAIAQALRAAVAQRGLPWQVAPIGCLGQCAHGPNLKAAPGGPMLHHCTAEQAGAVIDRLLAEWPS